MLAQGSYASMPVSAPLERNDRLYCLAAALDEINEGAVFLNAEGQLTWHNRAFDKLLVDNREGHLLVAAVIESAADFYQDTYASRGLRGEHTSVRDMTVGVDIALGPRAAERLWAIRHAASPILAGLPEDRRSLQVIEDACVPLEQMGDYIRAVRRAGAARDR